jgi:hypothetical protein
MKRTAFDERNDRRVVAEYEADHLPCRYCKASTDRETLSNLGARCQACYDAYIGRDLMAPVMSVDQKREALQKLRGLFGSAVPMRRWADRLRFVEEQRDGMLPAPKHMGRKLGESQRMTPFQRGAWRAVFQRVNEGVIHEQD